MSLSFRSRIILVFSVITIAVSGVLGRMGYMTVREIYLDQLSDQVQLLVRLCGAETEVKYLAYLGRDQATMAEQFYQRHLDEQRRRLNLANIFVFREDLRVVVSADSSVQVSEDPEPILLLNRTEIAEITRGQTVASLAFKGRDDQWYMWGFTRLDDEHWLCIQENANRLSKIDDLTWTFWSVLLVGLLFTVAGGWILAQRVASPVEQLVRFSEQLGSGDLGTPLPKTFEGELGTLAGSMDRMRQDLRRRHREREEMLAQIAHEIRNPLGGIELLAGLIREDAARERRDTAYLDGILGEVGRLKSLITAYLEYGRPLQAKREHVPVSAVVEEVVTMLKPELEQRKIDIVHHVNGRSMVFDPHHLRQITVNLIHNSMHAIGRTGRITISFKEMDRATVLEFSDNGPGIEAARLERIFEPFYSTDTTGFGLGLAVCKRLCEENHARITCRNNPDGGCTFSIESPLSLTAGAPSP